MTLRYTTKRLEIEFLESRHMLTQGILPGAAGHSFLDGAAGASITKVVLAGLPTGPPGQQDSPDKRIDPNTSDSPYAAVGSLSISAAGMEFLCTASLIDASHALTAAHCVDADDDGVSDADSAQFILNVDADSSHEIPVATDATGTPQIFVHEDFTGFVNGQLNDLAIVQLDVEAMTGDPETVPAAFGILGQPIDEGEVITIVGYGQSGDPVNGFTVDSSFTTKRVGENAADFFAQDPVTGVVELYAFDWDEPFQRQPKPKGGSLGNRRETMLGPGDSGGPSIVKVHGRLTLAGVNTGVLQFPSDPVPILGFGVSLPAYRDDIQAFLSGNPSKFILSGSANGTLAVVADPFAMGRSVRYGSVHDVSPPAAMDDIGLDWVWNGNAAKANTDDPDRDSSLVHGPNTRVHVLLAPPPHAPAGRPDARLDGNDAAVSDRYPFDELSAGSLPEHLLSRKLTSTDGLSPSHDQ